MQQKWTVARTNMKVLVAICVFLVILVQQGWCQSDYSFEINFDEDDKRCFKQLDLDEDLISEEFDENFKASEGNPQVAQFIKCAWQRKGILDPYGNLNKRELKTFLKSWDFRELHAAFHVKNAENLNQVLDHAVDLCSRANGYDIGDTVVKIYNCLIDYTLLKRMF